MSLNKTLLIGHVGQDPEIRYVGQAGDTSNKVATFRLATTERYRDRNGEVKENTEWHSIVAWRNLAELAEKYVRKGSPLLIVGHLTYREWTDNNGVKRNVTEIVADKIELCGGRPDSQSAPQSPAPQQRQQQKTTPIVDDLPPDDSGLPF